MNSTGFANLWSGIAVPVENASGQIVGALTAYVGPIFQACVLAYVISMLLIRAWTPGGEEPATTMMRRIALAAVIMALVGNAGTFNIYVTGIVQNLTNGVSTAIAGVIGGSANTVAAATFDRAADQTYGLGLMVYKALPWLAPKGWVLGVLVILYWCTTAFSIGVMFLIFMLASIAVNFVVSFGPLFIACAFFPYTRRFFDGWVQTLMAAVLSQVFSIGLMTLFINAMGTTVTGLAGNMGGDAAAGGFIPACRDLVYAGGTAVLFAALSGFSIVLAKSIAGAAAAEVPSIPFVSMARTVARTVEPGGGYTGGSGAGGGGGGAGGGPSDGSAGGGPGGAGGAPPPRQYAFQRNVGPVP